MISQIVWVESEHMEYVILSDGTIPPRLHEILVGIRGEGVYQTVQRAEFLSRDLHYSDGHGLISNPQ